MHGGLAEGRVRMSVLRAPATDNAAAIFFGPAVAEAARLSDRAAKGEVYVAGMEEPVTAFTPYDEAAARGAADAALAAGVLSPASGGPPPRMSESGAERPRSPVLAQRMQSEPAIATFLNPAEVSTVEDQLLPFLQSAVRERREQGASAAMTLLSELRPISSIFARLPQLSEDAAEGRVDTTVLTETFVTFAEAAVMNNGSLNQVLYDDKGIVFKLVFGLSGGKAPAEAALDATLASIEIRSRLKKLSLPPASIGVASGRAFVGICGPPERRELVLFGGDSVTLAARLMQQTEGGLLVSHSVFEHTKDEVQFSAEGKRELKMKGISETVSAHVPLRLGACMKPAEEHATAESAEVVVAAEDGTSKATSSKVVIHRPASAAVLAALERLQAAQRAGAPRTSFVGGTASEHCFLVEAPAGYGKSQLVQYMVEEAEQMGARVFTAAAMAVDKMTPFRAFRNMTLALTGVTLDSSMDHIQERAFELRLSNAELRTLGEVCRNLHPMANVANDDTASYVDEGSYAPTMATALRRSSSSLEVQSFIGIFCRLLQHNAPCLVVVEDGHWLDSLSWRLLLEAHNRVRGAVIVVTQRPVNHAGHPWHKQWNDVLVAMPSVKLMHLGELMEDGTRAILDQLAPGVTHAVVKQVHIKSGGVPLLIHAIGRYLLDSGKIRFNPDDDSYCFDQQAVSSSANEDTIELPDSIEAAIVGRLNYLSAPVRDVVKLASCIGATFSIEILEVALPAQMVPEGDTRFLMRVLRQLVQASLLKVIDNNVEAKADGGVCVMPSFKNKKQIFGFIHEAERAALSGLMLESQRVQVLHRLIEHLEPKVAQPDGRRYLPLISRHCLNAGEWKKACLFNVDAAQAAVEDSMHAEATQLLTQAVDLAGKTDIEGWRVGAWHSLIAYEHAKRHLNPLDSLPHALKAVELLGVGLPAKITPRTVWSAKQTFRSGAWFMTCRRLNDVSFTADHLVAMAASWCTISFLLATQASTVDMLLQQRRADLALHLPAFSRWHALTVAQVVHARVDSTVSRVMLKEASAICAVVASEGSMSEALVAHKLLQGRKRFNLSDRWIPRILGPSLNDVSTQSLRRDLDQLQKLHALSAITRRQLEFSSRVARLSSMALWAADKGENEGASSAGTTQGFLSEDFTLQTEGFIHAWCHWLAWWSGDYVSDLDECKSAFRLFELVALQPMQARSAHWQALAHIGLGDVRSAERVLLSLKKMQVEDISKAAHLLVHVGYVECVLAYISGDTVRLRAAVQAYKSTRTQYGWRAFRPPVVLRMFFLLAETLCAIEEGLGHTEVTSLAKRAFRPLHESRVSDLLAFVSPEVFDCACRVLLECGTHGYEELEKTRERLVILLKEWQRRQPGLAAARSTVLLWRLGSEDCSPSWVCGTTRRKGIKGLRQALAKSQEPGRKQPVEEVLCEVELARLKGQHEAMGLAAAVLNDLGFCRYSRAARRDGGGVLRPALGARPEDVVLKEAT